MKHEGFHEWPLAVFTALSVVGAGLLTVPALATLGIAPTLPSPVRFMLPGCAVLAAGLLVSLAHLGRPWRSAFALARIGRSRLSSEVALASATLAAGVAALVVPAPSPAGVWLPAVCSAAFLVSLGLVYHLPGQPAWRGGVLLTPLVLGTTLGLLALGAASDTVTPRLATAAVVGLAADLLVFVTRLRKLSVLGPAGTPGPFTAVSYPAAHRRKATLLAARFALADLLPCVLLLAGQAAASAAALALGILVDRLAFYLLAVRQTTEAEIAGVEALLDEM